MNRRQFIKLLALTGGAVALSSPITTPRIFVDRDEEITEDIYELWSKYTPITLGEVIEKQNLQQVNLAVPICTKNYEFKTNAGSFSITLSRCYNLSNEKLFDGNHSIGFAYSNLGGRFRETARILETILEQNPLICETAESLHSSFTKNAHAIRSRIKQICLPGETQKFDGFLGDLEKLVEEDSFSVGEPFKAVLINNYHPACVQDIPNRLDEEIRTRLLSPENQSYVSPDEIERLNKIFGDIAEKGGIDIRKSSFEEILLFYLQTIPKHFTVHEGEALYDEEKNKLAPSSVLSSKDKIKVDCVPPTLYLARLINYANAVNPEFHIHAFKVATTDFQKERKGREYSHHSIVGLVDTGNNIISFLNPSRLVLIPIVRPNKYNGSGVITSYRKDLIGYWPGEVVDDARVGFTPEQFLEESRRNLERKY